MNGSPVKSLNVDILVEMLTQASNTLILALLVSMTDLESLFSASDSDTNISDFFDIKKTQNFYFII